MIICMMHLVQMLNNMDKVDHCINMVNVLHLRSGGGAIKLKCNNLISNWTKWKYEDPYI